MRLSDRVIKRVRDSNEFSDLRKFIIFKVEELNSVDGLAKMSNQKAGEEAKIRLKAAELVSGILGPFIDFGEKKERSVQEIHKAKKAHGL